jgi:hypothetical protein
VEPEQKKIAEPAARCWATHTDLAGSQMERKKYYVIIEDEGKPDLQLIIVRGPGAAIAVEPYVTHEYDYDDFDPDEEEDEEEEYYYDRDDFDPEEEEEPGEDDSVDEPQEEGK